MESQFKMDSIEQAVSTDVSTVEHWRERYTKIAKGRGTASKIHKLLENDPVFAGQRGFFKVQNLQAESAGLSVTMRAVLILEQLPPVS